MKTFLLIAIFCLGCVFTGTFAEEELSYDVRSTEYTDLVVVAPAQLRATGLSVLNNVNVVGNLVVSGQECLNNQCYTGVKQLNISAAATPINILSLTFNNDMLQLPVCVDFRYFAKVATIKGSPQANKTFFCKLSVLLNSTGIWATLEKVVYVNGSKDGTATVTPTVVNGVLRVSFQDYTTVNGTLFYNVWGVNVTNVS